METCQNVNVKIFSTELLTSIPLRLLGHLYIASFRWWTCFASLGRYFSQICPLQRRVPLSGARDHSGCPAAGDLRGRGLPAPLDKDEKERHLGVGWGDCAILLADMLDSGKTQFTAPRSTAGLCVRPQGIGPVPRKLQWRARIISTNISGK